MAEKLVVTPDAVYTVYDDRILPLLEALGTIKIKRATEVEWNSVAQEWIATLISTGEVISHGKVRSKVIEDEVKFLESRNLLHEWEAIKK